ncbi:MAG: hypothetical protein ACI3V3_07815 [Faecousia sp.]
MKRQIFTLVLLFSLLLGGGIAMLLGRNPVSLTERRNLAQWSDASKADILNGRFMDAVENAAMDQFPMRENLRTLKSLYLYYGIGQLDNNGIYLSGGRAEKLDYPLREISIANVVKRVRNIQDTCLNGTQVNTYFAIVPDKNYFLAAELGYPTMDYARMEELLKDGLSMEFLDISDALSQESYYKTDPHWRQECLPPVAKLLCEQMGTPVSEDNLEERSAGTLLGAYAGQSALPLAPDPLLYLTSEALEGCRVTDLSTGKPIPLYNLEKAQGADSYDLYLGGAAPIQEIYNPAAPSDKELVLFRDSFGSSLAPLLAASYSKVTLVDIRYMSSTLINNYITFTDQDVLFLYSSLVLNHSESLK